MGVAIRANVITAMEKVEKEEDEICAMDSGHGGGNSTEQGDRVSIFHLSYTA